MLTLLELLSSVALLVWGTYIIWTGIMRVFGTDLRRMLGQSIGKKSQAFLAGIGCQVVFCDEEIMNVFGNSFQDVPDFVFFRHSRVQHPTQFYYCLNLGRAGFTWHLRTLQ
ncbi:MAG TPA: hypothetical protein ACHBX0_10170 [Arsenophonus sp.]